MTFDLLHTVLITGFVSTFVGVTVHVITKTTLAKSYVTRELFVASIEAITREHQAATKLLLSNCESARRGCPIVDLKQDIAEIKDIQKQRTRDIARRQKQEDGRWRVVFDALKIPMERQNQLLADCGIDGRQ